MPHQQWQSIAQDFEHNEASNFVLVGRNQEKLDRVAKDLYARSPQSTTKCIVIDFNDQNEITDLAEELGETLTIDKVLIAHGTLPVQADCQSNISEAHQALLINGVSPSLFAEAFAKVLEKQDYGNIILISSVAGDRGRKSNYVYGSAKGLVTRYAQGLQHRLHKTNVNLLLVKPVPLPPL
ncbi:SDR family NAD(P)-dependent oxidoreductase [Marinomonas sp. GJ51-6]|uniref:SDR family NAD(P)-dependent oxidoreductase n=1 Tax=Marinomonas sp. GJ51-6 TaxID=2992802 RepID=UPI002934FF97|nr:SDR family NAD(P)-dependent oxidoreductase [Marinomonas sp. GJ51-6]WOD07037.1 SDR family NAD(P)-dependent oxidoreductase [Marinomonas sp. GJ51-6]